MEKTISRTKCLNIKQVASEIGISVREEDEMTLDALIKRLQKLQVEGYGQCPACADAQRLLDNSNGVFQIAEIQEVHWDMVPLVDDDGFRIENADGSEREMRCVVMK